MTKVDIFPENNYLLSLAINIRSFISLPIFLNFLSTIHFSNFQIRKNTGDRSRSQEYSCLDILRLGALFIFPSVPIIVVVLLLRIDELPRYRRICQRSGLAAILGATVNFRRTVLSRVLLRFRLRGLYASRERRTGSA